MRQKAWEYIGWFKGRVCCGHGVCKAVTVAGLLYMCVCILFLLQI